MLHALEHTEVITYHMPLLRVYIFYTCMRCSNASTECKDDKLTIREATSE